MTLHPGPHFVDENGFCALCDLARLRQRARRAEHRCDFCSSLAPTWRYPCDSFVVDEELTGSEGDWAACDVCHDAIEIRDLNKLAYRSLHGGVVLYEMFPAAERAVIEQRLRAYHRSFLAHRRGDAVFRDRAQEPGPVLPKRKPRRRMCDEGGSHFPFPRNVLIES